MAEETIFERCTTWYVMDCYLWIFEFLNFGPLFLYQNPYRETPYVFGSIYLLSTLYALQFRAQWKEKVAVAKKSEQKSLSLVTTEEAKIEGWDDEEETDWKQIIQPLLPHIRFPIMNGEYFTSNVVDMKILSTDDCTLIMQFLFTQKENDALKYSTKKRFTTGGQKAAARG